MSDEPELNDVLAYLATELLGWRRLPPPNTQLYSRPDSSTSSVLAVKWLLTGNGMLEIIEAMRERGCEAVMRSFVPESDDDTSLAEAAFDTGMIVDATAQLFSRGIDAPTLPEAVARAAYAALQEQS